jgi:hypothetical protein
MTKTTAKEGGLGLCKSLASQHAQPILLHGWHWRCDDCKIRTLFFGSAS